MKQIFRPGLLPLLLLPALIVGCSDSTSSNAPLGPGQGSSYIYDTYMTDSVGQTVPGSNVTSTMTVDAVGITYNGKSNVHRFVSDQKDTTYMHYEPNGDVAIYGSLQGMQGNLPVQLPIRYEPGWILFPFGSKTATALPPIDTTIVVPFQGTDVAARVRGTGSVTPIGQEQVTVAGETISTEKAILRIDLTATAFLLLNVDATIIDTVWYSPKIGLTAKDGGTIHAESTIIPGMNGGSGRVLKGYSLK